MAARLKIVRSDVYHVWAHQTQDEARSANGNKSFDGPLAYSYRACIGAIITNAKGDRAYLINTRSYSVTTSGHQSELRSAIPRDALVFPVEAESSGLYRSGSMPQGEAVLKQYAQTIAAHFAQAAKRRKAELAEYDRNAAARVDSLARQYAKFAGLRWSPGKYAKDIKRAQAEAQANEARKRQEAKEWQARARQEAQEDLERFRNGEPLRGYGLNQTNIGTDVMRLSNDGQEVQTGQHVAVPVAIVRRALSRVLPILRAGSTWKSNGDRIDVGHFNVASITPEGVLIGCHWFERAEVERLDAALAGVPA